jgi:hypothetical protein
MIFLLVATFFSASPAWARLGENEAQTTARYGPRVEMFNAGEQGCNYRTLAFTTDEFHIVALFIDGICEAVVFQKLDQSAPDPDELDLILKSNSNGFKWQPSNLISDDKLWDRDDGALARYDTVKHTLGIYSSTYLRAESFRKKMAEKKKADGF